MSATVTLIIGASGGLGQALCRAFAGEPIRVGIHAHSQIERAEATGTFLNASGTESAIFRADLRDSGSVKKMFDELFERWGRLDLLINSAGIVDDRIYAKLDEAAWSSVLDVNLTGAFYCLREAGRIMQKQGGHIINIASLTGFTGRVGQAAYCASKRALIALTYSAAKEWGGDGIRVNAVLPGLLETKMTASLSPSQKAKIIDENILKRSSSLEEVSEFIRHLSKMKGVSGQIFNLDSRIYP